MSKPAGYLINTKEGPVGAPGFIYDYILASNGLFLRCESPLLRAVLPLDELINPGVPVKGLAPMVPCWSLVHGQIPYHLYTIAENIFLTDPYRESYFAVVWDGRGYHIKRPEQKRREASVPYGVLPNTVLDIHSHGAMAAFFSRTDDHDEQGFRLSLVLGELDTGEPSYEMRLCCYGNYWDQIDLKEVFNWQIT